MESSVRTTIVLSEKKLKELKRLAYEQDSSINRLLNEALDKTFFKPTPKKNFSNLRGIWKKNSFSEDEINEARLKFKKDDL